MPTPSDLVHETTTTTGTGNLTVAAVNGKRTFNTAFGTGGTDLFDYFISNREAAEWEIGTGHLSDATTLVRDTVVSSSNADAAVNFSAGTKDVTNDVPAADQAGLGLANRVLPVGMVSPYAGASAPTGWLLCFGQAVSRTTYAALFAVTSTTYGVGDGSTTFNLPDLRGRVVAGQDDMGGTSANRLTDQSGGLDGDTLGDTGGAETHTLTIPEMPAHTHTVDGAVTSSSNSFFSRATNSVADVSTTNSTGGDGAHNNVQPTIILNYIIFAGV